MRETNEPAADPKPAKPTLPDPHDVRPLVVAAWPADVARPDELPAALIGVARTALKSLTSAEELVVVSLHCTAPPAEVASLGDAASVGNLERAGLEKVRAALRKVLVPEPASAAPTKARTSKSPKAGRRATIKPEAPAASLPPAIAALTGNVSIGQIAAATGVGRSTIHRDAQLGRLKRGSGGRITADAAQDWFREHWLGKNARGRRVPASEAATAKPRRAARTPAPQPRRVVPPAAKAPDSRGRIVDLVVAVAKRFGGAALADSLAGLRQHLGGDGDAALRALVLGEFGTEIEVAAGR